MKIIYKSKINNFFYFIFQKDQLGYNGTAISYKFGLNLRFALCRHIFEISKGDNMQLNCKYTN